MSTSGITFGGLASGLDTQAIIQALLSIEQRPITALENKRASYQSQKSLFSDLEQRLQKLNDAADDIRKATNFLEFQATVADPTLLTATASAAAQSGTYAINVTSLAEAQVATSGVHASASAQTIAGNSNSELVITIGSQSPVNIAIAGELNSLDDIAAAINAEGLDVKASVLQTSTNEHKLVLTGAVGTENSFTVTTNNGTVDLDNLASQLTSNVVNAASDAVFDVNGIEVTRSSNQVSDAIAGVTIDLHEPGGPTTLTVSTDTTATGDKVNAFVNAYNGILDFMEAQAALDPNTNQAKSPLFGDSTLRTIRSSLRSLLGGSVSTGNQAYELLSQVGIDSDRTGRLTFDRAEFDTAVTTDETAVKNLFADAGSGIAVTMFDRTKAYLDTIDGLLVTRQKGFDDRIRDTDAQIAQAERRLVQTEASLTEKFSNLEVLLGRLQTQGSALGGLNSAFTNNR